MSASFITHLSACPDIPPSVQAWMRMTGTGKCYKKMSLVQRTFTSLMEMSQMLVFRQVHAVLLKFNSPMLHHCCQELVLATDWSWIGSVNTYGFYLSTK